MINNRCPYCGNEIVTGKLTLLRFFPRLTFKCKNCGNRYRLHYPKILLITIPFGLYAFLYYDFEPLKTNIIANIILIILATLAVILITLFIPLEKYQFGDVLSSYESNYNVKCLLIWNRKSIFYRVTHCFSGNIFPICFIDRNNRPISNTWCVVLHKVHHLRKKTVCRIEFVLSEAPKDLLQEGNEFYLFDNKRIVAKGEIIKILE